MSDQRSDIRILTPELALLRSPEDQENFIRLYAALLAEPVAPPFQKLDAGVFDAAVTAFRRFKGLTPCGASHEASAGFVHCQRPLGHPLSQGIDMTETHYVKLGRQEYRWR